MSYFIETWTPPQERLDRHGRRFNLKRTSDHQLLTKGYLRPDGEIVITAGVVPDDEAQQLLVDEAANVVSLVESVAKAAKDEPAEAEAPDEPDAAKKAFAKALIEADAKLSAAALPNSEPNED